MLQKVYNLEEKKTGFSTPEFLEHGRMLNLQPRPEHNSGGLNGNDRAIPIINSTPSEHRIVRMVHLVGFLSTGFIILGTTSNAYATGTWNTLSSLLALTLPLGCLLFFLQSKNKGIFYYDTLRGLLQSVCLILFFGIQNASPRGFILLGLLTACFFGQFVPIQVQYMRILVSVGFVVSSQSDYAAFIGLLTTNLDSGMLTMINMASFRYPQAENYFKKAEVSKGLQRQTTPKLGGGGGVSLNIEFEHLPSKPKQVEITDCHDGFLNPQNAILPKASTTILKSGTQTGEMSMKLKKKSLPPKTRIEINFKSASVAALQNQQVLMNAQSPANSAPKSPKAPEFEEYDAKSPTFGGFSRKVSREFSFFAPQSLPKVVQVFESAYFSIVDEIIMVCDDHLRIIYNNYHEKYYPRILRKLGRTVNVDSFRMQNGGHLSKIFSKDGPEFLQAEVSSLKQMLTIANLLNPKLPSTEHLMTDEDASNQESLNNMLEFLAKFQEVYEKKNQKEFNNKTDASGLKVSKGYKTELIELPVSIHDVLNFFTAFFKYSCTTTEVNTGIEFPLTLKIYSQGCIQLKFTVLHSQGSYYMFTIFQNVESQMAMMDLNNKLNYSYLLICSLSHELFTPLNHLSISSDLLTEMLKNPGTITAEGFQKLVEEARNINLISQGMNYVIQNILDFAKYITRNLTISPKQHKISDILEKVNRMFTLKMQRKKLSYRTSLNVEDKIFTDEDKLIGLLYTFLDNAVKYTQYGGICLNVSESVYPGYLRFEIIDTGIGIDEEDLNKLSTITENPYSDITTRAAAGIGIGIRVAQVLIMYLTGGDILMDITSKKGSGTTVTFEILKVSRDIDMTAVVLRPKKTVRAKKEAAEVFDSQRAIILMANHAHRLFMNLSKKRTFGESELNETNKANMSMMSAHNGDNSMQEPEGLELQPKVRKLKSKLMKVLTATIVVRSMKKGIAATPMNKLERLNTRPGDGDETGRFSSVVRNNLIPNQPFDTPEYSLIKQYSGVQEVDSFLNPEPTKRYALIVDDDIMNADYLEMMLEMKGFDVVKAFDGENAIEQVLRFLTFGQKFTVVFMDYSMPNMNGDECTKRLKVTKFEPVLKNTPIIGLTAHRDDEITARCKASGMDIVGYKPMNIQKLSTYLQMFKLDPEGTLAPEEPVVEPAEPKLKLFPQIIEEDEFD